MNIIEKVNKNTYNEIFEKLEFLFKILFLLYTMIGYNGFLYGNKIISVIMWPMLLVGVAIVLWKGLHIKEYKHIAGFSGMLLFGVSFSVSTLLNYKYELKQNIITLLFLIFYFSVMYMQNKKKENVEKEFRFIGIFYLFYMTLSVICSLTLFVMHYGNVRIVNEDSYELVTGFLWGRLWGVFLDPNVGAILACIAITIAIYFILISERKLEKGLYIIVICLNVLYIAFSDSRTGMLCLACLIALEIYCYTYRRIRGQGMRKWLALMVVCILAASIGLVVPKGIVKTYNRVVSENDVNANEDKVLIERGYELSEDPSNRRFDIWKSGIEIFGENWIFGTSYNGIRPYAYENMPDTYIVNNDSQDFRNLHNEFLNVLVAQGILGMFSVILMIVPVVILVIKNIFRRQHASNMNICFFVCASIICVGTMLTSAGFFYYVCPYTPMFWSILGYLQNNLVKEE